jgi:hypothetical protein
MRLLVAIVLVAFVVVMLTALGVFMTANRADEYARNVALVDWLTRWLGLFLAASAGMMLLLMGVGAILPIDRVPVLTLTLLAGLMLIASHWGLALAAGGIVVAMLCRDFIPRFAPETPPRFTPSATPPV